MFDTQDYLQQFAGLGQHMGRIEFPTPFTVGDYRRWFEAAREQRTDETEIDDVDELVFVRQYRGAMAVGTVYPYSEDDLVWQVHTHDVDGEVDEFTLPKTAVFPARDQAIDLGLVDAAYDDVPMPWMSFVVTACEEHLNSRLIVETDQQRVARRTGSNEQGHAFQHDYCLGLLPAMADHRGYVVFREPLTKSVYKKWRKEFKIDPKKDPRGAANSWRMRALAGAVTLVKEFKFRDLDWREITADKCEKMPLEIASFLTETAGVYLSRRLTAKNF